MRSGRDAALRAVRAAIPCAPGTRDQCFASSERLLLPTRPVQRIRRALKNVGAAIRLGRTALKPRVRAVRFVIGRDPESRALCWDSPAKQMQGALSSGCSFKNDQQNARRAGCPSDAESGRRLGAGALQDALRPGLLDERRPTRWQTDLNHVAVDDRADRRSLSHEIRRPPPCRGLQIEAL